MAKCHLCILRQLGTMLWHFFGLNISPNFLFHFLFCWRRRLERRAKQYRRSGKAFLKTGLRGNPSSNQSFCCPHTKKLLFTLITLLPLTCYLQCLKSKMYSSKYSAPNLNVPCFIVEFCKIFPQFNFNKCIWIPFLSNIDFWHCTPLTKWVSHGLW